MRLTPTVARWPITDGDKGGGGGETSKTSKQASTRKTKAAVDRRQNKKNKALSVPHCAATTYYATAVPTAMRNRVTKTMSVAPPLRNNWSKRSTTLKLFCGANLVQHHLPPLALTSTLLLYVHRDCKWLLGTGRPGRLPQSTLTQLLSCHWVFKVLNTIMAQ